MTKKGFTLIELMITVVFIAIGVLIAASAFGRCGSGITGMDHEKAIIAARAYAVQMGIEAKGVECTGMDSDGDGYVSCSISYMNKAGDVRLIPIECAASFTFNSGCKAARQTVVSP